jgi:hypothetical protein
MIDVVDGNDKESLNNYLEGIKIASEGYVFKLSEFKNILTEFNCIDDYAIIDKFEQLIDAKEKLGVPDYVFEAGKDVPVMVSIHMSKNVYAITTLMPNPNKQSSCPYRYAIQISALHENDKSDLEQINQLVHGYKEFKKTRGKMS